MDAPSGSALDMTSEQLQAKLGGITGNALLLIVSFTALLNTSRQPLIFPLFKVLGICDEVGLFKYMAAMKQPQTSMEIAQGTNLNVSGGDVTLVV